MTTEFSSTDLYPSHISYLPSPIRSAPGRPSIEDLSAGTMSSALPVSVGVLRHLLSLQSPIRYSTGRLGSRPMLP